VSWSLQLNQEALNNLLWGKVGNKHKFQPATVAICEEGNISTYQYCKRQKSLAEGGMTEQN